MKFPENIPNLYVEQRYELATISQNSKALKVLSEDTCSFIREEVALNDSTPVDVLIKLSTDVNSGVRAKVAKNPKLPIEELTKLAKDKIFKVRLYAKQELERRNFTPPTE